MKRVFLFFVLLFIVACDHDDCKDIDCFTPPNAFNFEILDKTTGENLYSNGSLKANQLKVYNAITKTPLEYTFIDENNLNIITLYSVGWQTEKITVTFELKEGLFFNFYVDAERKNENCCSFTVYNETKVENAPFEYDASKNLYSIFF
jgi:hypothetical protein